MSYSPPHYMSLIPTLNLVPRLLHAVDKDEPQSGGVGLGAGRGETTCSLIEFFGLNSENYHPLTLQDMSFA